MNKQSCTNHQIIVEITGCYLWEGLEGKKSERGTKEHKQSINSISKMFYFVFPKSKINITKMLGVKERR